MKLTELNPRWVGVSNSSDSVLWGITFDCPHCRTQRLGIAFEPPIDPAGWIARGMPMPIHDGKIWKRDSGVRFEDLSISPSVDAGFEGHWHGFIKNGEIT